MKISISAAVTLEEKAEIDKFCRAHDIKIAQLIRWALRDYMDKSDRKDKTGFVQ